MHLTLAACLTGHSGIVWAATWNGKGTMLATCGEDKTIRLWSEEAGGVWRCLTILTAGHNRTIRCVAWSACDKFLASASFDGTVAVWDRKSGQFECNATLEGHENEVKCVAWSRSGNFLATCSRDKSVWLWDVDEDEEEYMCASVLQAHTQDVKRVAWHPDVDVLASCSYDNKIKLFREDDDADWVCFATLAGHASTVWAIAFDATGERLASVSDDKTVKIWREYKPGNAYGIATQNNDPTWKCESTLSGFHGRCIYDVAWSAATGWIATAAGDDAIRVFKASSSGDVEKNGGDCRGDNFELACAFYGAHAQDVNGVAWNPTRRGLLASASDDETAKIWQVVEDPDDNDDNAQ